MQIERHFAVKVIPLHGFIEFRDFEELVDVEPILNPSQEFPYAVYQSRFEQQPPNYETYHQTEDYEQYGAVNTHDHNDPRFKNPISWAFVSIVSGSSKFGIG